jgi:hypothetical protein
VGACSPNRPRFPSCARVDATTSQDAQRGGSGGAASRCIIGPWLHAIDEDSLITTRMLAPSFADRDIPRLAAIRGPDQRAGSARVTSPTIGPGTRVRLSTTGSGLTLRSPFGTIKGPDRWGGWIVPLDEPATYWGDELAEIREFADHMTVVPRPTIPSSLRSLAKPVGSCPGASPRISGTAPSSSPVRRVGWCS